MHAKIFARSPENAFEVRRYTAIKRDSERREAFAVKGFSVNKNCTIPRVKLARGLLYI